MQPILIPSAEEGLQALETLLALRPDEMQTLREMVLQRCNNCASRDLLASAYWADALAVVDTAADIW